MKTLGLVFAILIVALSGSLEFYSDGEAGLSYAGVLLGLLLAGSWYLHRLASGKSQSGEFLGIRWRHRPTDSSIKP